MSKCHIDGNHMSRLINSKQTFTSCSGSISDITVIKMAFKTTKIIVPRLLMLISETQIKMVMVMPVIQMTIMMVSLTNMIIVLLCLIQSKLIQMVYIIYMT